MDSRSNELLETIFSYITKIATLHNPDDLLIEVAKMGRDIVKADRCSVWMLDTKEHVLWTKVAQGVAPLKIPAYSGIVGETVSTAKAQIINDVYANANFNKNVDLKTGYKTETMVVIPIHDIDNNVVGAMQVINKEDHQDFTEEDLRHLKLASTYVAESIASSLLREEINQTQRELVHIMGVTGESRSKETGNHVKRVAEYSYILAKLYGLGAEECDILKDASPMHDIGKIAIPDAVLNKPGRFNEEERRIMDTHAALGYNILKGSQRTLLKAASIVAYEHHEKYDGTGYPNQLKGEDIHIYGRITALADVFDALGSDRVYKKAWDDERIFSLFEEEKGKHFDPTLMQLFLDNREEFLVIRDQFKDTFDEK